MDVVDFCNFVDFIYWTVSKVEKKRKMIGAVEFSFDLRLYLCNLKKDENLEFSNKELK